MNIKKGIILAVVAGAGAGVGAITTALMMTNQCHEMIEDNEKRCNELNEKLEEINSDVIKATTAFNTYREKITFFDNEAKSMHSGAIEAFRRLAEEGKTYDSNIKKISNGSIELVKKELREMLSKAEQEIDNKRKDTVDEMSDTLKQLRVMISTLNGNMQISDNTDGDITEKMIEQLETDKGRTSKKRVTKK